MRRMFTLLAALTVAPGFALADATSTDSLPDPTPDGAVAVVASESGETVSTDVATDAPSASDGSDGAAASPEVPEVSDAPARNTRRRRNRWSNTLSLGGTIGAGSPLGIAGLFLEYRPFRYASLSAGAGFGSAFGPAVAGTLYIDPISTRGWSLGVGGSLSHNFSIINGQIIPGRAALPTYTDWVGVEVQTQFRTRNLFVRIGFGREFLLNTQAFKIATPNELANVPLPSYAFATPVDAVRAASRDENFGVWYVHIDLAPVWRL